MKKYFFLAVLFTLVFTNVGIANACISTDFYAKLPNSSAIYYVKIDQKFVFPDAKTFLTYFDAYDNANIHQLANEEQDVYGIKMSGVANGGIMKYKANTKKLIKHVNSPKVYAVDKDQKLHWIQTGEILQKLGYSFANINDLGEVFFVSYDIGEPITSPVNLDGSIIKYQGDDKVYLIEGGKKRRIILMNGETAETLSTYLSRYEKVLLEPSPDVVYPDGEDQIIYTNVAPQCL